jgi:hypothetical protein
LGVGTGDEDEAIYPVRWGGYRWNRPVKKGSPLFPRRDT